MFQLRRCSTGNMGLGCGVLGPTRTSSQELIVKSSGIFEAVGGLNLAMVGVFTPRKPARAINQSSPRHPPHLFALPDLVHQHITGTWGPRNKFSTWLCGLQEAFNFSESFTSHLHHGSVCLFGLEYQVFVGGGCGNRSTGLGLNVRYE